MPCWRRAKHSFQWSLTRIYSTITFTMPKERQRSGLPENHAGGFLKGETSAVVCGQTHLTRNLFQPAPHFTEVKIPLCTKPITKKLEALIYYSLWPLIMTLQEIRMIKNVELIFSSNDVMHSKMVDTATSPSLSRSNWEVFQQAGRGHRALCLPR